MSTRKIRCVVVATRSILGGLTPAAGCPFCLRNGKIPADKFIDQARWAYMVNEYSQVVRGTMQIMPPWHDMTVLRWLKFLWSFFWMLRRNWPASDFNLNVNFGRDAGQTLPHPHVWIIPRAGAHAGKGLAHFVSLEEQSKFALGKTLNELVQDQLKY